jgi:hypothetical protein
MCTNGFLSFGRYFFCQLHFALVEVKRPTFFLNLEIGYWLLDIGYWKLEIGYWILDIGNWSFELAVWSLGALNFKL